MSTQRTLSILAMVLGTAFLLFALWKWALFGIDPDVGTACGITGTSLFIAGGFGLIE